jgi:hypothetical protein
MSERHEQLKSFTDETVCGKFPSMGLVGLTVVIRLQYSTLPLLTAALASAATSNDFIMYLSSHTICNPPSAVTYGPESFFRA